MAVRFYSSLDTGAPALGGTFYERFRTVLLACLVNGYGSKPGAGWTLVHDVAGGFSLSNGDGIINFVAWAGNSSYVAGYIMEAVTDGSTALAQGVNRRSAGWTDGSTSSERWTLGGYGFGNLSNPHWIVVADDKTVIAQWGGGLTTSDDPNAYSAIAYFGNYINALGLTGPASFCALGGHGGAQPGYFGRPDVRYGMALRNPFTGLVDQGPSARYGPSGPSYAGRTGVSNTVLSPGVSRLSPVRAGLTCFGTGLSGSSSFSSARPAGYLRGLLGESFLSACLMSNVCSLLGLPNAWQTRCQRIELPGGGGWVPIASSGADLNFFASLESSDWE